MSHQFDTKQHTCKVILTALALACLGLLTACGPSQTTRQTGAADTTILGEVSPGDQIKAEVVVKSEGAYREHVVVATKAQTST